MNHTDRPNFIKLFYLVNNLFNKRPSDEITDMWFNALMDYDYLHIKQAFEDHIKDTVAGKKPPLIADIIERCRAKRQITIAETPKLERPAQTPEKVAENKAKIREILNSIGKNKKMAH